MIPRSLFLNLAPSRTGGITVGFAQLVESELGALAFMLASAQQKRAWECIYKKQARNSEKEKRANLRFFLSLLITLETLSQRLKALGSGKSKGLEYEAQYVKYINTTFHFWFKIGIYQFYLHTEAIVAVDCSVLLPCSGCLGVSF